MKTKITILFIFLLTVSFSYGQKKKSSAANKNWGIGVKVGDPLGLSLKKYLSNDKALELIVGRSFYWGGYDYDYYYNDRFKNDPNYRYRNAYNYSTPIALQLRYLMHKDIGALDGLQWYVGAGAQFRYQSFRYYYDYYDQYGFYVTRSERAVDYGIGLDFIGGVEYTFEDVPISIALDANLYLEILDRPFFPLLQGGVTGRYNF